MSSSSVSADTVVYFITGSSRGIGYGLVEKLAARPNVLIFASARDLSKADKLQQLAKQHNTVRVVKLAVDNDADYQSAVKQVEAEAGRVDVLLANAGIATEKGLQRTGSQSLDELREHFEVNTFGPVRLFNAFLPLLERSSNPKFSVVASVAGSIASQDQNEKFLGATYGASKAAVHFFVKRVHVEHPKLTAFPLHPGWVKTDMGNAGAKAVGMEEAPLSLEASVTGIIKLLDESTRDTHGGRLWAAEDGKQVPW